MEKTMPPERTARRRILLLLLVLLLTLFSHLRPSYRVWVAGQALPGRYRPAQLSAALAAAREMAQELLGSEDALPEPEKRLCLSLFAPDGDPALLSDALLRASPGITLSDEVWVNGTRLGTVSNGTSLQRALQRSIRDQMPLAAVSGNISGQLELRRVYTRAGQDTPEKDMILLITGMAPVVYVDAQGKLA